MLETLLFAYALLALLISTITDLKKREVLDSVSFTLLAVSSVSVILFSLMQADLSILLSAIIVFISLLLLSIILYYARQWGGGDTKLLIALSIPLAFPLIKFNISLTSPVDFLINLAVIGSLYGLFFAVIKLLRHTDKFIINLKREFKKVRLIFIILILLSMLLFLTAFLLNYQLIKPFLYSISIFILVIPILHIVFKSIEAFSMIRVLPTSKLTPGDWIVDKKIREKFNISSLGIEQEQILKLKKSKIRFIKVKEGIPFVPTFLIAYIITMFYGNMILSIMSLFF